MLFRSLLLALGLAAFGLAVSWSQLRGPAATDTIVVLQRGMGLSAIAASLEREGVIRNAPLFSLWLRFSGQSDALRAGEYRFPPGASGAEVADILLKGLTYKRRLTIPEGVSTERALALVADAPALQGAVPSGIGEGALLPETYQYEWGDARGTLIARMQRAQADLLNALWPQRAPGLPLQSPEQAVVLASIVERETAVADERPRVAGVFLNRLKLGMRLQSDPTVEYGLRLRGRPEALVGGELAHLNLVGRLGPGVVEARGGNAADVDAAQRGVIQRAVVEPEHEVRVLASGPQPPLHRAALGLCQPDRATFDNDSGDLVELFDLESDPDEATNLWESGPKKIVDSLREHAQQATRS